MSIELKQAAQQAVDAFDAFGDADDFASLFELTQKMRALSTAIQQAEAQQPATGEPVVSRNPFASRCYTMSESHLSGHRLIVGFEKLGDAQDAHEWVARQGRGDFTHPAPSVPDGWKMVPVERSYDQRAKALIAFNRAEKDGKDRDDALQAAWDASLTAAQAQEGGECLPIRGNQVTCSLGTGGCGIQHKGGE